MKTILINGKEIKTNYGGNYAVWNGNDYPKSMKVAKVPFGSTEKELLEELAKKGYKRVRFVEVTTRVRGYHRVYAFYK